jgi:hypothetical protein
VTDGNEDGAFRAPYGVLSQVEFQKGIGQGLNPPVVGKDAHSFPNLKEFFNAGTRSDVAIQPPRPSSFRFFTKARRHKDQERNTRKNTRKKILKVRGLKIIKNDSIAVYERNH